MPFNKVENVPFTKAVDAAAIGVVPVFAKRPGAEPTLCNPLLNLMVVLTQTFLKVARGVAFNDAA